MNQQQKNKEFIINNLTAVSGTAKNRALLDKYITDEVLIGHIEFFETAFAEYEVYIDEILAEGNKVMVQARAKATHFGKLGEIPPTYKKVDFPFIVRYEIENNIIVNHWMLADNMILMQQLGVVPTAQEVL